MHIIAYSTCWECKQIKEKLVCFDGLEKWQDNAEICLDCLVAAEQIVQPTDGGLAQSDSESNPPTISD